LKRIELFFAHTTQHLQSGSWSTGNLGTGKV
jgi:hypothetical protein